MVHIRVEELALPLNEGLSSQLLDCLVLHCQLPVRQMSHFFDYQMPVLTNGLRILCFLIIGFKTNWTLNDEGKRKSGTLQGSTAKFRRGLSTKESQVEL